MFVCLYFKYDISPHTGSLGASLPTHDRPAIRTRWQPYGLVWMGGIWLDARHMYELVVRAERTAYSARVHFPTTLTGQGAKKPMSAHFTTASRALHTKVHVSAHTSTKSAHTSFLHTRRFVSKITRAIYTPCILTHTPLVSLACRARQAGVVEDTLLTPRLCIGQPTAHLAHQSLLLLDLLAPPQLACKHFLASRAHLHAQRPRSYRHARALPRTVGKLALSLSASLHTSATRPWARLTNDPRPQRAFCALACVCGVYMQHVGHEVLLVPMRVVEVLGRGRLSARTVEA